MGLPSRDDWIWVAGFFDGEGSITLATSGNNLQVALGQKDQAIIREVIRLFGGKFHVSPRPEEKIIWEVRWHPKLAETFLEGILPFLRLKRAEIQFALDWIRVDRSFPRSTRSGGTRSGKLIAVHRRWREEMVQRLAKYREDKSCSLEIRYPSEGLRNPLL